MKYKMVSMSPNTLHYNFTHKWKNPCISDDCYDLSAHRSTVEGNLFDVLSKHSSLSKTVSIIKKGHLVDYFKTAIRGTIFVTTDDKLPDSFIKTLDSYDARKFILSYTLKSDVRIDQLRERGDSVYESSVSSSPVLSMVDGATVTINKVGKPVSELRSTNGIIIIMDNIADVLH
jgi:hypothetical protein